LAGYPLIEELPGHRDASAIFKLFRDRPYSFFLDSGMTPSPASELGRYSFMGSDPFLIMKSRGKDIILFHGKEQQSLSGDPFRVLEDLLNKYSLSPTVPVPFAGGAVGYLSYDLCHFVEKLPCTTRDDLGLPEAYLAFYDTVVAFDHWTGKAYLISTGFPEMEGRQRKEVARQRLDEVKAILGQPGWSFEAPARTGPEALSLSSNFSHRGYLEAVEKAREYICAGDIFQVNLSQRLEADLPIPPYELFLRLRRVNPAPFACYLNFDEVSVVSASPERFLKLQHGSVETRPIKGTRPRGKSRAEDSFLAGELVHSVKDRAEHMMIVDLERNDLGRVCRFGSVKVVEMAALETFPTVFHLTSTIAGQLDQGKTRHDLLKAIFPGGSITGAPKVRAMEIIDELEPTRRGIYTGAIGYLSFSGEMDLNIAIRTFVIKDKRAYFHAGGGIVFDSRPEAEYEETLDKARALIQALQISPAVMVEAA
jgi:para-aminobenzoate synthetase component I